MSDAMIQGKSVEWWEGLMRELSEGDDTFRGITIDHDLFGISMMRRSWLPRYPWLGIKPNGQRIMLQDIGWVV